jgi:hypothetical protein
MSSVGCAIVDNGRTCAQSNMAITLRNNSSISTPACDQSPTAARCLMLLQSLGATLHERMAGRTREWRQPVERSESDRHHRVWMHESNVVDGLGLGGWWNVALRGGREYLVCCLSHLIESGISHPSRLVRSPLAPRRPRVTCLRRRATVRTEDLSLRT